MEFEEAIIPPFVWEFVKKHTKSFVVAGILAMIIWNYMKKNKSKIKESYKWIDKGTSEQPKQTLNGKNLTVYIKRIPLKNSGYDYEVFVNEGSKGVFDTLEKAKKKMSQLINTINSSMERFNFDDVDLEDSGIKDRRTWDKAIKNFSRSKGGEPENEKDFAVVFNIYRKLGGAFNHEQFERIVGLINKEFFIQENNTKTEEIKMERLNKLYERVMSEASLVEEADRYAQHYFKKNWKDLNAVERRVVKQNFMKGSLDKKNKHQIYESVCKESVPSNILDYAKRKGRVSEVKKIDRWLQKLGLRIGGGTAIGKYYDTLILDIKHQDSAIYFNTNTGNLTVFDKKIPFNFKDFKDVVEANIKQKESLSEDYMTSSNWKLVTDKPDGTMAWENNKNHLIGVVEPKGDKWRAGFGKESNKFFSNKRDAIKYIMGRMKAFPESLSPLDRLYERVTKESTKYTDPIKLLEDSWKNFKQDEKEKILKSLGLDTSWGVTKDISELVKRGGGMIASKLLTLMRRFLSKKDGEVIISDWNKGIRAFESFINKESLSSERLKEGTWKLGSKSELTKVYQDLKILGRKTINIVGDDEFHNALNNAIDRVAELAKQQKESFSSEKVCKEAVEVKIYSPKSVNNQEDKFKVVKWKNGIQDVVKFVDTEQQANEMKKRLQKESLSKRYDQRSLDDISKYLKIGDSVSVKGKKGKVVTRYAVDELADIKFDDGSIKKDVKYSDIKKESLSAGSVCKEFKIQKGSRVLIQSDKVPKGFYDIISVMGNGKTIFIKYNNKIIDIPITDVKKTGYDESLSETSLGNPVATYRDIKIYNPTKGAWILKYNGSNYDKRHLDGWDVELDGRINNADLQKTKKHIDDMLKQAGAKESLSSESL